MTYETDHCQISQIVNTGGGWFGFEIAGFKSSNNNQFSFKPKALEPSLVFNKDS